MGNRIKKPTKEERKAQIAKENLDRIENIKDQIKYQIELKTKKKEFVETEEEVILLSNKLIDLKAKGLEFDTESTRPRYESDPEYISTKFELERLDFKRRKEPAIKLNVVMTKADLQGIDRAIDDLNEYLKAAENANVEVKENE